MCRNLIERLFFPALSTMTLHQMPETPAGGICYTMNVPEMAQKMGYTEKFGLLPTAASSVICFQRFRYNTHQFSDYSNTILAVSMSP